MGCLGSATQLVPAIISKAKSVTQIIRSPHWVLLFDNLRLPQTFLKIMRAVPFFTTLMRCIVFVYLELGWLAFIMNSWGERSRKSMERTGRNYILTNAPEKYRDILTPDYAAGCKVPYPPTEFTYFLLIPRINI